MTAEAATTGTTAAPLRKKRRPAGARPRQSAATTGVVAGLRQLRFALDANVYRLQQQGLALSTFVGNRLWHLALNPGQPPPTTGAIMELERRYRALLDADVANVKKGYYPRDLLFQFPLPQYLRALPAALLDVPRILLRRYRRRHGELPRDVQRHNYPGYYWRTFHWQTDGWLSDRSARLYDPTVEFLFGGTADVMRRMAIPPVATTVTATRRPRILDIGCGTGRFLRQLQVALPAARLYGLDLSRHYVNRARVLLSDASDVSLLVDNAEALPFADGFFDAVTSIFLFHELPADVRRRVASEAYRVLKERGRFVICDSAQLSDSAAIEGVLRSFPGAYHEPYYKGYLRDDLGDLLRAVGFEVDSSCPWLVSKVVVGRKTAGRRALTSADGGQIKF